MSEATQALACTLSQSPHKMHQEAVAQEQGHRDSPKGQGEGPPLVPRPAVPMVVGLHHGAVLSEG